MADVTRILNAIEGVDPQAADQLLPLVYEEQLKLDRLMARDVGYVGVQHGISGLITMDIKDLSSFAFQYTSQDMSQKRN